MVSSILAMLSDSPVRTLPMLELSTVTFGSLSRLSHTVSKLGTTWPWSRDVFAAVL